MISMKIEPLRQSNAEEIANNWHYEGIYSFYDMQADLRIMKKFYLLKRVAITIIKFSKMMNCMVFSVFSQLAKTSKN